MKKVLPIHRNRVIAYKYCPNEDLLIIKDSSINLLGTCTGILIISDEGKHKEPKFVLVDLLDNVEIFSSPLRENAELLSLFGKELPLETNKTLEIHTFIKTCVLKNKEDISNTLLRALVKLKRRLRK